MKQTKDQLAIENATLKTSEANYQVMDSIRRKEFARAFGWRKQKKQYDYGDPEIYEPNWTEIYIELGKLLERQKSLTYITIIEEMGLRIQENDINLEELKRQIRKEIHPNL